MGRWKVEADFDLDPPTHIAGEWVHEWLGELLVIRCHAEDPVPSSISVVAGREDVQGTDQPSGCGGRFPCEVVAGRVRSLTPPVA
jgi:hypothetical protein